MSRQSARSHRLRPAPHGRLSDHAHAELRASILDGRFPMGTRLVETQLAEDLQMNRAPVREAVRRLVAEGLLEDIPHRGTVVREFGPSDLVDLYNARLAIEPVALRLFMRLASDVAPLHKRIDQMRRGARRQDARDVAKAELAFHTELLRGSGNHALQALFAELSGHLLIALTMDDAEYEDLGEIAEEHVPLTNLIESGNENDAASELQTHIVGNIGDLIERLGGDAGRLLIDPR